MVGAIFSTANLFGIRLGAYGCVAFAQNANPNGGRTTAPNADTWDTAEIAARAVALAGIALRTAPPDGVKVRQGVWFGP